MDSRNEARALKRIPQDMMLGGLVNEPVRGEVVSLKIMGTERSAYFEAIRDVSPGEELLTLYGEEYKRDYPSPYDWIHTGPREQQEDSAREISFGQDANSHA